MAGRLGDVMGQIGTSIRDALVFGSQKQQPYDGADYYSWNYRRRV